MDEEKIKIRSAGLITFFFLFIIWTVKAAEMFFEVSLFKYGINPSAIEGLRGVLFSPLIHSDFNHLMSNSFSIMILLPVTIYFYITASARLLVFIYLVSGILTWIIAQHGYHAGASGLIYGLASFLFFSGLIRKDHRALTITTIVFFLYSSMIYGLIPHKPGISWEGHIAGAVSGLIASFIFRKYDPAPVYEWENEEIEEKQSSDTEQTEIKKEDNSFKLN